MSARAWRWRRNKPKLGVVTFVAPHFDDMRFRILSRAELRRRRRTGMLPR